MSKKYVCLTKETDKKGWSWPLSLGWTIGLIILLGAGIMAWISDGDAKLLPKPTQDIYVVDQAKIVNEGDKKQMLALGHDMNQRFGAQLVVVTMDTLDGADIREYTNKLFRSWGIGSKEKNNGVLLLIAKKDRKFRIEVGYGLEGRITDGYAGSVLDGMKPDFKKENYSPAILLAYSKLAGKIYEEYGAAPPQELAKLLTDGVPQGKQAPPANTNDDELDFETIVGIIIIFAVIGIIMYIMFRLLGGFFYLLGSGGPSSGGYDSRSYGSDSYDSGSSDSFGGGDSGGGGSDDSW